MAVRALFPAATPMAAMGRGRGWGGVGTGMGWQIIAAAMAGYLALLGRSAWKQGEFRQFLRSLAIVAVLCALLAGTVAVAMLLDRP